MDRGIKIAILVACLLSLGLGLIWDRVIDASRSAVMPSRDKGGPLSPDPAVLVSGDMRLPKPAGQQPAAITQPVNSVDGSGLQVSAGSSSPVIVPPTEGMKYPEHIRSMIREGKYVLQAGDSPWKVANTEKRFKFLGKSSTDWVNANPGARWTQGELITIP